MKKHSFVFITVSLLCLSMWMSAQTKAVKLVPYTNNLSLYGYKDSATGKIIIPPKFDYASQFNEGMGIVTMDGKYGYVNNLGKLVVPCKYDLGHDFSEGLACVEKEGKYGFINKQGTLIVPCKYEHAGDFINGLAPVKLGEKCGYINKTGQTVIPLKYDWTAEFYNGLAIVGSNGKEGLINKTGKFVLTAQEWELKKFSPGIYQVYKNRKYGLINSKGEFILDTVYDYIETKLYMGENELVSVKKDGFYGYISPTGEILVPPEYVNTSRVNHPRIVCVYSSYDFYGSYPSICGLYSLDKDTLITEIKYNEIAKFNEGMAAFSINGKIGYLNEEGKEQIPPVYEFAYMWEGGYGLVMQEGKELLIDKDNTQVTAPYDVIMMLKNKMFVANIGGVRDKEEGIREGKFGLLDRNGKPLTDIKYDFMEDFTEGISRVVEGETFGLLDTTGRVTMYPQYRHIDIFTEGLAPVYSGGAKNSAGKITGGKWGYINNKGEMIISPQFDNCRNFSEGMAPVVFEGKLGFIDKNGGIKFTLDSISDVGSFSEGYCWVKKGGLCGYIDATGKFVIPVKFQEASDFTDGLAKVQENGTYFLIDKKGKVVRKFEPSQNYDDDYFYDYDD